MCASGPAQTQLLRASRAFSFVPAVLCDFRVGRRRVRRPLPIFSTSYAAATAVAAARTTVAATPPVAAAYSAPVAASSVAASSTTVAACAAATTADVLAHLECQHPPSRPAHFRAAHV